MLPLPAALEVAVRAVHRDAHRQQAQLRARVDGVLHPERNHGGAARDEERGDLDETSLVPVLKERKGRTTRTAVFTPFLCRPRARYT